MCIRDRSTDEQFRFEVLLKNPTSQPLGAGTVALTIDNHRAETAADLSPEGERESLELASVEAVATQGEKDQRIDCHLYTSRRRFFASFDPTTSWW